MATTGVGFRWLDILEKEFDKACVELDASLSELDTEDQEVVFASRQKIATLSSCFAQLTHKALTIFQNSAKLEESKPFNNSIKYVSWYNNIDTQKM